MVRLIGANNWFLDELRRKVGDGKLRKFWEDIWVGEGLNLRERFPRLFNLEVKRIVQLCSWTRTNSFE